MGTSTSKASPLAPTFERMATWDLKSSRRLLQDYKDKDLDFGLDAQGLADLLGGDKDWAESIIDAFSSPTGIINALAFVCGACLVCSGPALEKAAMIFDALDFDGTEQISMDEMTISFLCTTRGFCVIAGIGTVPSDEELETVTLQAYRDLNKGSTQSITKAEFMKWIIEFASGMGAPPTREVTLQNALEQFRVVPPSANAEEKKEENNASTPLQDDNELGDAEYESVAAQNDEQELEDPPQQETDAPSESVGEYTVDQEHDPIEQTAGFTEPVEPEYVATEVDGQLPSDGDATTDQDNESNLVETEMVDSAPIDDGGQGGAEALESQIDDQMIEQEAFDAQQSADDTYHREMGNETHLDAALDDPESDYPTFVEDGDELPQGSESFTSEERGQNAPEQEQNTESDAAESETAASVDVQDENSKSDNHAEAQQAEPVAVSEELVADEPPPEPSTAQEADNDDLEYEQDEFAQETPRTEREAEAAAEASHGDVVEIGTPTEDPEQNTQPTDAPIESTAEDPEPVTPEAEAEAIPAQDFVDQGGEVHVDEAPAPIAPPDQDPVENAETGEEGVTEAAAIDEATAVDPDPAEDPATDLNAFDTYDYEQPQFDGSSGLPPPEPQELLDDAATIEADPEAGAGTEEPPVASAE